MCMEVQDTRLPGDCEPGGRQQPGHSVHIPESGISGSIEGAAPRGSRASCTVINGAVKNSPAARLDVERVCTLWQCLTKVNTRWPSDPASGLQVPPKDPRAGAHA